MNSVFENSLEKIIKYLESDSELEVINTNDISKYKDRDIHIIAINKTNGLKITIAVKSDTYGNTGNYCFEILRDKIKNYNGSFSYCEADYIFYYFVNTKKLHILPYDEIKNFVLNGNFRIIQNTIYENRVKYVGICKLVPVQSISEISDYLIIDL
jgi:hypothetical protein